MPIQTFTLNGQVVQVDADDAMPLLWVLRDLLDQTGTRYGCGIGACGSCSVLLGSARVQACITPVASVAGLAVTTIEGLSPDASHPLQLAWIAEDVAQCGFCQAGQIMAAEALLQSNPSPTDADIDAAMSTVVCRCGTYARIRAAIHRAAGN